LTKIAPHGEKLGIHPLKKIRADKHLTWEQVAAIIRGANPPGTKTPNRQTLQNIAQGRPAGPGTADVIHNAFPQIKREELIYFGKR